MRDLSHIPEDTLDMVLANGLTHRQQLQRQHERQMREAGTVVQPTPWNYGTPIRFGDDATRAAHLRRCRQIALTMRSHRWQVAPLHRVTLMSGHVLRAGDVVRIEHFVCEDEQRMPGPIIERLVQLGVVLESAVFTSDDDGPQAA